MSLNLNRMAIELLQINENFYMYLEDPRKNKISDFELVTFEQMWGSTSGGFQSIGGSAMTEQRTYVFIPINCDEKYLVFFGGRFAYSIEHNDTFIEDLKNHNIAGVKNKDKYK